MQHDTHLQPIPFLTVIVTGMFYKCRHLKVGFLGTSVNIILYVLCLDDAPGLTLIPS